MTAEELYNGHCCCGCNEYYIHKQTAEEARNKQVRTFNHGYMIVCNECREQDPIGYAQVNSPDPKSIPIYEAL